MKLLSLYTTSGCHLCEVAQGYLEKVAHSSNTEWHPIEISDSETLIDQYGIRIPVIRHEDTAQELGWPFTLEELKLWIESL